jgi:hypothetical protein
MKKGLLASVWRVLGFGSNDLLTLCRPSLGSLLGPNMSWISCGPVGFLFFLFFLGKIFSANARNPARPQRRPVAVYASSDVLAATDDSASGHPRATNPIAAGNARERDERHWPVALRARFPTWQRPERSRSQPRCHGDHYLPTRFFFPPPNASELAGRPEAKQFAR